MYACVGGNYKSLPLPSLLDVGTLVKNAFRIEAETDSMSFEATTIIKLLEENFLGFPLEGMKSAPKNRLSLAVCIICLTFIVPMTPFFHQNQRYSGSSMLARSTGSH